MVTKLSHWATATCYQCQLEMNDGGIGGMTPWTTSPVAHPFANVVEDREASSQQAVVLQNIEHATHVTEDSYTRSLGLHAHQANETGRTRFNDARRRRRNDVA